jgi:adenylate cyclase
MTQDHQVLIIEDDRDMIELLSLILKRGGYQALSAVGGREGLRVLEKTNVDLVLLDLMMNDINGWTVLETIKADHALRSIPVIIVSAKHHLEEPAVTAAHAHQFKSYLVKPFVVRDLLFQIGEAIQ